ncbi:hypothetical protein K439DRAFT_1624770 [Ramaria rubella]|nr:hypothetical protein K439DRAFT_1624770 [Ramaria rubella]
MPYEWNVLRLALALSGLVASFILSLMEVPMETRDLWMGKCVLNVGGNGVAASAVLMEIGMYAHTQRKLRAQQSPRDIEASEPSPAPEQSDIQQPACDFDASEPSPPLQLSDVDTQQPPRDFDTSEPPLALELSDMGTFNPNEILQIEPAMVTQGK